MAVSYFVKALIVFAAIAIVARRSARTHHPYPTLGPANQVTMLRAWLVAVTAGFIGEPSGAAFGNAAVAAASIALLLDGVDGWLARRTQMTSAFGARFDMEIDALLIQVLAILAWQHGKAGPWVLTSGLLRYIFVAAGWQWPWMQRPLSPSVRRKAICVVQIVGLLVAVLPVVPPAVSSPVAAASLVVLAYSFLVDTVWLWRRCDWPQ